MSIISAVFDERHFTTLIDHGVIQQKTITNRLTGEGTGCIIDNYGGLNEWLGMQIDAAINKLKN